MKSLTFLGCLVVVFFSLLMPTALHAEDVEPGVDRNKVSQSELRKIREERMYRARDARKKLSARCYNRARHKARSLEDMAALVERCRLKGLVQIKGGSTSNFRAAGSEDSE